ncbi:hypothetical protein [Wolbachia endosymbiont of Cantharis cryptica]|uniref:hypothetical protein n=1 Tax=Wolbachia endosymbiont of Cantharis cryptica TaxID=3066132 RepID=UPI00376EBD79
MLGTTEENTYFTRLKAGGRFSIYAFGIYLAATFTVGCLGLMIGFPLLTFPLAMLISHPVIWIAMGVVLTVAYKIAAEPLFRLAKGYINGKRALKGEEVKPQELQERPDENLQTLAHQTNRGNYTYWLQQHDIAHIARVKYGYSENSTNGVFFCIPGNLEALNERLIEYKNKVEQENRKVTFTSVVNLGNRHWTTLVVAYNSGSKQFRAYYCDSFSADLPSPGSQRKNIELANEIKNELVTPLNNQVRELTVQGREGMSKDVQKTAQTCRDKKDELVNILINTDTIVSALEAILEIGNDNIRSSKTKQQNDGHNCGIFALENAHKITQMLNKGKSFDEIDKELSEYKLDLNKKRREFAEVLMNDKKWRKDLESGLLCNLPPRTETSQSSTSKAPTGWCSTV